MKFNGQHVTRLLQSELSTVYSIYFDNYNRLWFGNADGAHVLVNDSTMGTEIEFEIPFAINGNVYSFVEMNKNVYYYLEYNNMNIPKLVELKDHSAIPFYFKSIDNQDIYLGQKCLIKADQNNRIWILSKMNSNKICKLNLVSKVIC